jgi:pimeloyl-ACP methyl ester carboxylesterase
MPELQLAVIDVKPGAAMESQSGLQLLRPRIYGAWAQPAGPAKVAAIVMHPTSNFMGHYLIGPLAERGVACMGLNSRYVGNDSLLLMERVIQDLGAGVQFLRAQGYDKVVLVGNSGGASLSAFYQAQAEKLTIETMLDGDPATLSPADLPPVQGLALCAAHEGRSTLMRNWIDPSVIAEHDALAADPALDMYDPANGPPFTPEFLARFKAAQRTRLAKIEHWVEQRLRLLRSQTAPGSAIEPTPIRAASTCRWTPTTGRWAASGATALPARGPSTTRPARWAASPRSRLSCRSGRRTAAPTGRRTWPGPACRRCCAPTPATSRLSPARATRG